MGIIIRKGMMNIPVLNLVYTLVHRTSYRWNIRLLQESKDLKKRKSKCHHIIRVLIYVCTNRTKKALCAMHGSFLNCMQASMMPFDPHFIIQ